MMRLLFSFIAAAAAFMPSVVWAQGMSFPDCSDASSQAVCVPGEQESDCADLVGGAELCGDNAALICCVLSSPPSPPTLSGEATPATATGTPAAPTRDVGRGGLNEGRSYLINPLGGRTVPQIIGRVVAWFGTAAGALFFLYLLWGGAEWMSARGDQAQAQRGRQRIVGAVAGIAVVLLAYVLVSSIVGVVGTAVR